MRLWHPNQLVHGLEGPHGDGQLDGGDFNFQFKINNFFSISISGRPQRAGGKQPGEGSGDVHLQPAQAGQGAGKEEHFEKK